MLSLISSTLSFIIGSFFTLYMFVIIARIVLFYQHAEFSNPQVQSILKFTNPLVKFFGFLGSKNIGRLETKACALLLCVSLLKIFLMGIFEGRFIGILGIILGPIVDAFAQVANFYFFVMLTFIIMSWVRPQKLAGSLISKICQPVLAPLQKHIPPMGGFNLNPFIWLVIFQALNLLLIGIRVMVAKI